MNLSNIKVKVGWWPFRYFGTAMVVWRNTINTNGEFTRAYIEVILDTIINQHEEWPKRFKYKDEWTMIEQDDERQKIRTTCEELCHVEQQSGFYKKGRKKIIALLKYWWYSRGSVFYYKRAPNEKAAKAKAAVLKMKTPKEVYNELTTPAYAKATADKAQTP